MLAILPTDDGPPDVRPGAYEQKIDLPPGLAGPVLEWARRHLVPDAHGSPEGAYRVQSVYFDTAARDVHHRSDGYRACKYRVRRYGAEPIVHCEEKRRVGGFVTKRRTALPCAGELSPRELPTWFAECTRQRDLIPVCSIAYHRVALVGGPPTAPMRLTLDRELVCLPRTRLTFAPLSPPAAQAIAAVVLELKYGAILPRLFKELLAEFRLVPSPVSKYRLAMASLGVDASPTDG